MAGSARGGRGDRRGPPESEERRLTVGPGDDGRPVERVLVARLGVSWPHAGKLLRQGRVRRGARALARGDGVRRGEELVVVASREGHAPRPPQPNRRLRVRVVFEDADLAVVAKAPGVPVHPGPGHGTDTLLNALVARYPELVELGAARGWGLVHRLDRDTSGLLVVARSARAHEGLVAAFGERRVSKEYLALVAGAPASPGEARTPVDGKEALTRWERVETRGGVSLVRAWPVTGRMHQIRSHLAEAGCPVLGDAIYGRRVETAGPRAPRLALHAHRLAFAHPVTGAPVELEEPLPRDLRRVWDRARRRSRAGGAE